MRDNFIRIFLSGLFFLQSAISFSQIISPAEGSYQKVFVATDNFGASYLDTLQQALKIVKSDTPHFELLNDLAYYWHTRNLDSALYFTEEGLAQTAAKKSPAWYARFQITQGAILLRMEKLDSAYNVLMAAKKTVNERELPFLLTQLGYVFERRGQLDTAADLALASLNLGEKLNDKRAIAVAYSDLSNLFWKQSKFEKGLEYGLKSLRIFEERKLIDLDYDFTLYVVGNNYLSLKKYDQALQYYNHSIVIGERYGFYNNLSDAYISLVDLYSFLNRFPDAEEAGKNAIKFATLLENNFMLMRSWLSVGKMQLLEGKYTAAIGSLRKSITIATAKFGDEYFLSQAYETLGKAYAGNRQYKEAYEAFAKYDQLKDMIFTAEADQRISLLQTEFDVAQKETTIGLQETEIRQQKTKQSYIIIIASLLLLLLLLLYKIRQSDRKKNKLLKKQNTEKEFLIKEIHHRVKNNLEIVSSLLELQSAQVDDPNVAEAMLESQNRVHSMSLIHQKLYMGKNLASIPMKEYIINLSNHVLDSFGKAEQVSFEYDVEISEMDVETAIPIGLIVNELLTNALKYAFPKNGKGKIKICLLKSVAGNSMVLRVADNGTGQQKSEVIKGTGFGTQLISLLTQQLDGTLNKFFDNGTIVSLEFKLGKAA